MPTVSKRMHRMDARALRGKDASKGERTVYSWLSVKSNSVERASVERAYNMARGRARDRVTILINR